MTERPIMVIHRRSGTAHTQHTRQTGQTGQTKRARRRSRTALVGSMALASIAALAGCSDSGGVAAQHATAIPVAAVDVATTPTAEAPASTSAETVAEAPPATVPIDAPSMLQQALDAVAGGYHFRTAVSLDGVEVLVTEGDRIGDSTRLTIWTGGTSLSYVITPVASWVVPDGGEWEPLDSAPATTDPLLALRAPSAVSGTSPDGVAATLVATVPATALGVPSDATADVSVVVNGSTLLEVRYQALLDGRTADVVTVFSPVLDPTPITPPI